MPVNWLLRANSPQHVNKKQLPHKESHSNAQMNSYDAHNTPRVRTLRYGLGILWLIDAFLQMQPGMFHQAFYGNLPDTVMPSLLQDLHESAPTFIAWAIAVTQWLFTQAPIVVNTLIIALQLAIAISLLYKWPRKIMQWGAMTSIAWSLVIWVFGEALGGVASWGDMTVYSGFPGSALFYAVASWLLWNELRASKLNHVSNPNFVQTAWLNHSLATKVLACFFFLATLLQLLPINGQWDMGHQMSLFANSGFQTQPSFLSNPVMAYVMWVSNHPFADNVMLSMMELLAGLCIWYWNVQPASTSRWLRGYVYLWLVFVWWFGTDFGYLFSGLSTDPNTPPILFVLLLAFRNQARQTASQKLTKAEPVKNRDVAAQSQTQARTQTYSN